jgi:hypothetical protein
MRVHPPAQVEKEILAVAGTPQVGKLAEFVSEVVRSRTHSPSSVLVIPILQSSGAVAWARLLTVKADSPAGVRQSARKTPYRDEGRECKISSGN